MIYLSIDKRMQGGTKSQSHTSPDKNSKPETVTALHPHVRGTLKLKNMWSFVSF